jgi:hypothetical protein
MRSAWCWVACALAVPGPALADEPQPGPATMTPPTDDGPMVRPRTRRRDIVVEIPGERSLPTKLAVGGIAAGGVLAGVVGLYFHLDSRSAVDNVDAGRFVGKPWTQDQVDQVDRAARSRTRAAIGYGVGGALVIGAVIAFIVTDPKSETSVIHTTRATPIVSPVPDGAVVGGAWRF